MSILWDSLLASAAARELDASLAGARVRAHYMDREGRDLLVFLDGATLVWRLHPDRGQVFVSGPRASIPEATPLRGRALGVRSDPDERVVVMELQGTAGERLNLTLELMTNQWNALLVDVASRRIVRVLRPRVAGGRRLAAGAEYAFPEASRREGRRSLLTPERWMELLLSVPPGERAKVLLRNVAYTSSLTAPALLGAAAETDEPEVSRSALEEGYALWRRLRDPAAAEPVLLRTDRGPQPYPLALPGFEAVTAPSILAGMERSARAEGRAPESAFVPSVLVDRLERELHRARARLARLRDELEGAADPGRLRSLGDLLLARFREVPRGQARAELEDFDGGTVELELDPSLPPQENARRYYDRAARAERARERLPGLIGEAEEKLRRMEGILEEARTGELGPERAKELALGPVPSGAGSPDEERRPYRRYRSSGGLEIRVGRGARSNDALTFHHARPDDVWLHARHAAGAHVILRWQGDGNPPHRDLLEAAVLAALNSKARTSGTVPVDWTRRKYVRSPRKSAPGVVIPDRVQTVFVEPDPALERRLRAED